MLIHTAKRNYELTTDAEQLICRWIDMAEQTYPGVHAHETTIATALIAAGRLKTASNRIAAPDIYSGWNDEIARRIIPSIGLCPPHDCLFRSIVEHGELYTDLLDDREVNAAVQQHWRTLPGSR